MYVYRSPRNKIYKNRAQLLSLMTEVYNEYLQQSLVDVAVGRRRLKALNFSGVPFGNISRTSDSQYLVRSTCSEVQYEVDMMLASCSCDVGNTGDLCKHQIACSEHFVISLPQEFDATAIAVQPLVELALGEKHDPGLSHLEELANTHQQVVNVTSSTDKNVIESAMDDIQSLSQTLASNSNGDEIETHMKPMLQTLQDKLEEFKSEVTSDDLSTFISTIRNIKTCNQLKRFLIGPRKYNMRPTNQIRVLPTWRKAGLSRGSRRLLKVKRLHNTVQEKQH